MKKILSILFLSFFCLTSYAQFTLNGADEYLRKKAEEAEARRVQDSIRQAQLEEQQMMASDIRLKLKWISMATYRQSIGIIESSYNLSYYGYFLTKEKWTYPISLRVSGSESYNENNIKSGYNDWSQHTTDFGLSGFRRLKDNVYVLLGGHLPLGWERYRVDEEDPLRKRHFHLLIGAGTEERLMYISPNKVGLVMSCGFYQRLINSRLYNLEAGFSLEVGIKF
jgi:hypothetical protein